MWVCPKCKNENENNFCGKCGKKKPMDNMSNDELLKAVKSLKTRVLFTQILCIVLFIMLIILAAVFAIAYYSVWENIKDLWTNSEYLWSEIGYYLFY